MVSLKMAETYVNPMLSYNQRDNEACGVCYQHGKTVKLKLKTFSDCENIQRALENDDLHTPKECLVVGVTGLNENAALQPATIWPSCVKNDSERTINIISEINDVMKTKYGYPIVNFCTVPMVTRIVGGWQTFSCVMMQVILSGIGLLTTSLLLTTW